MYNDVAMVFARPFPDSVFRTSRREMPDYDTWLSFPKCSSSVEQIRSGFR